MALVTDNRIPKRGVTLPCLARLSRSMYLGPRRRISWDPPRENS